MKKISLAKPDLTLKLKNNFPVSDLISKVDIDFIFATVKGMTDYRLLNVSEFGITSQTDVEAFIQTRKVVIIDNETMQLKSFNINEDELLQAMLEI